MKLEWNDVGENQFEVGIEKCVLYVPGLVGVPWNGLVALNAQPTGGEAEALWLDSIPYATLTAREEFRGSVEAFYYPEEFLSCVGVESLFGAGFFEQYRSSFGMSFVSRVGSDINGTEGYRIHLLYNLYAVESEKTRTTLTDGGGSDMTWSWDISSPGVEFPGHAPISHLTIKPEEMPQGLVDILEGALHGTDTSTARLPSIPEVMFMVNDYLG